MAGTPEEIEMEANVSIDMENKSITKRKIAEEEEEEEEEEEDDLNLNTSPFASVKASEKMEDPATEIERPATEIEMEAAEIERPAKEIEMEAEAPATEIERPATEIEKDGHVTIDIKNNVSSIGAMLASLSPTPSECCIYRVPRRLRKVNEEAYTPHLISIGPFHHGKEHFQSMEEYKLRHLMAFLDRPGPSLERCLEIVHTWEQRARDYYSETINLSSDEFAKMILVDGSFIVEFLLRLNEGHPKFDKLRMVEIVISDMILIENQLPFFLLDALFDLIVTEEKPPLLKLVHDCCCKITQLSDEFSTHPIKHLVDYIHHFYLSSISEERQQQQGGKYERPPTVTQLRQAGIKFKMGRSFFFDIDFSNGILKIPQLNIHDPAGSLFRNLIAFEQCHMIWGRKCIFSDYFSLLDGMIDTFEDVDLLLHSEILTSRLGSSKEVSTLFNNIAKDVRIDSDHFYFSDLCQGLKAYCKSPWHKWIATLRRDYFSNPWAVISVIAAVVIIVLTFIQATCSIISL